MEALSRELANVVDIIISEIHEDVNKLYRAMKKYALEECSHCKTVDQVMETLYDNFHEHRADLGWNYCYRIEKLIESELKQEEAKKKLYSIQARFVTEGK